MYATSEHNTIQEASFSSEGALKFFAKPLPKRIDANLSRVPQSIPAESLRRVLDVGAGTGFLVPHLQAAGCQDILGVDLSRSMLEILEKTYGTDSTLGNEGGVRTWTGDILDLPTHQGRATAIFLNAVFGNLESPRDALIKCATSLLLPNGYIVISHPQGRAYHERLRQDSLDTIPHLLPDEPEVRAMIHDLPLELVDFVDEKDYYCCVLKIPEAYALPGPPLKLKGPVVTGFQRGSKQMGIPTANISPAPLEEALEGHPRGVYFGWAKLMKPGSEADGVVAPMVMNVGIRPTIQDGSHLTVECHILHKYADDFYGEELRVVVIGYVRPEMKMTSLDMLVNRIKVDIAIASEVLKTDAALQYQTDSFFSDA